MNKTERNLKLSKLMMICWEVKECQKIVCRHLRSFHFDYSKETDIGECSKKQKRKTAIGNSVENGMRMQSGKTHGLNKIAWGKINLQKIFKISRNQQIK